jgi:DNA-binding NtrC family response regulator
MEIFDKKVLIIDDVEGDRKILVNALAKHGFECLTAEDGEAGLKLLSKNYQNIFLVIVDIHLPVMNGIAVLNQAYQRYPLIEYLILTADDSYDFAQKSFTEGAAQYFLKPVQPIELFFIAEKAKEVYRIRKKNSELLRKLSKNDYAEIVNKEYRLIFEQMAKEQIRKDNTISMLLKFIKDNGSNLLISQEIKNIMDPEDDFEVL